MSKLQIFFLGKPAQNGGQITKEYLMSLNVNIDFKNCKRKKSVPCCMKSKKAKKEKYQSLAKSCNKRSKKYSYCFGKTVNYHANKLIMLDICKTSLKKNIQDNEKYNDYFNSLVPLQTLVLKHVSHIEKKILTWKNEFV